MAMTNTMRALIKDGGRVVLSRLPRPEIAAHEVLVSVAYAGVCRTDLQVIDGRIPSISPLILGHELAGKVVALGGDVTRVRLGDRVTVDPRLPCGRCSGCALLTRCTSPEFLGIRRHGAFADAVAVPAAAVVPLPADLSLDLGAYVEPVAAALAVLGAGIAPGERGLIWGRNRFAELVREVLRAHAFEHVEVHDVVHECERDAYDFAIETGLAAHALDALVRAVRPRGRIVLKSRQQEPVSLDLALLVQKELTLRAVAYGSFESAVSLLASGRIDVSALLAVPRPLEEFEATFAAARASEARKLLFAIGERT